MSIMSAWSRLVITAALVAGGLPVAWGEAATTLPAIVPLPARMEVGNGSFTISAATVIVADGTCAPTARQLVDYLKPAMGLELTVTGQAPTEGHAAIILKLDQDCARLGTEGYRLVVTAQGIRIAAVAPAGLFYGLQTLRQLLPAQVFAATPVSDVAWSVPCVTIEDQPRFPWRGLMLDSGHDFQRFDFVTRFIDLMAMHKFNIFHWHLTDLGTWSMEIKGRPRLLAESTRGPGVKPGHYTQDEIREVVRYAAARHITILPEIDMPGHEPPALIAYPELDCPLPRGLDRKGSPARPWEFCVGNEQTFAFLEEVLTQVVDLFPGTYIHIGGDECPKGRWLTCPRCQVRMKDEHCANGEELQSYFIRRIGRFLQTKGRRMIGWDEILEGGLAPDATVMSWRGMNGGIAAAKADHDVVMAPKTWTYFDYPNTPVETVYGFEPVPRELTAAQAAHVLGAQAQMWTDGHPSEVAIDALVHPRAAALAEVVWSPAASRDYEAFVVRLQGHLPRLAALGVHYRPLITGTLVGEWSPAQTSATPTTVEWPIAKGLTGAGGYDIRFQYEHGRSRYRIHEVAIVQDGTVLATDRHEGSSGFSDVRNVYHLELPAMSAAPVILRARVSTDAGPDSHGRILIGKRS